MALKPLPPAAIVAARLRQRAAGLILDAEELEATCMKYEPKRKIDIAALTKRMREAVK